MLASCATTNPHPQQFRNFFLPPLPPAPPAQPATLPPVPLVVGLYVNETPTLALTLPSIPRPSDTEFLLKRAEDRFAAGKKALQEGRVQDARGEFNRAIGILLTAPEAAPERSLLEQRLEQMVNSIYRYDADQMGASEPADQVSYDKRPLDEILELTFPVDPSMRNKVRAQIQATVSQLPLEENDAVLGYINFFSSTRGKKIMAAGLRHSGRYKSMIERILAAEGLPQELIFLAQAESGFFPHAVSNKLCVGLWQFAKFRGQEYGLEVTPALDARMDPERATRAAARHLHDLYTQLGDWYLAMAAYNCGPQCVDHAVQRTGYADFWALRRAGVLPQETANYVPAILAMIVISKNAKEYGLDDIELENALEFDTIELEAPTHLALVAAALDRPVSELRDLNPAVLKQVAPAGYGLHVPKGTLEQVQQAFSVIPANRRDTWRIHRVEGGETAAAVAKIFGTTSEQILSVNHDQLPDPGSFAAIPVSYSTEKAAPKRTTSKAPAARAPAAVSHKADAAAQKKSAVRKPATVAEKKPAVRRTPGA